MILTLESKDREGPGAVNLVEIQLVSRIRDATPRGRPGTRLVVTGANLSLSQTRRESLLLVFQVQRTACNLFDVDMEVTCRENNETLRNAC